MNLPFIFHRARRLGLALLILSLPACGLTDYEKLMRETQEREEIFRAEQKYLGTPVQIPTQKDKDNKEVAVADVFFRPPKGVDAKFQQSGMMWRYAADARSEFVAVDLAFGDDSKDFSRSVLNTYGKADQAPGNPLQITAPGQRSPMVFDTWDFSSGDRGYSAYVLRGSSKPLAIVFIYKTRLDNVRKVIEISLQSLGVDQTYSAARNRYNQKSPWKLQASP